MKLLYSSTPLRSSLFRSSPYPSCTPSALRAPYRVLRRTEHCAPLTRHGLAFSQPSKGLATPPARGTVQAVLIAKAERFVQPNTAIGAYK